MVLLLVTKSAATNNLNKLKSTKGTSKEASGQADLSSINASPHRATERFVAGQQSVASSDRSMSIAQRWRSEYSKKIFEAFVSSSLRTSLNVPSVFDDALGTDDAAPRDSDTASAVSAGNAGEDRPDDGRPKSRVSSDVEMGKFFGFYDDPSRRFLNVSVDKPDFDRMRMDNFSQDSAPPPVKKKSLYICISMQSRGFSDGLLRFM
jgi:hypothetical protein